MTPTLPAVAQKTRQEVQTLTSPLLARIATLQVTDAPSYAIADSLLARIREARKTVEAKLSGIIDPINEARKAALELKHSLDDPLQDAEATVRAQMREFKMEEHRKTLEIERVAREEADRLRKAAEEKQRKAEQARTQALRNRLEAQGAELELKAAEAEVVPIQAPVRAANSGVRVTKKWRVKDFGELLRAAANPDSDVPEDVLVVDTILVNRYFKEHPEVVASWPGIEIYDDIGIVGR